MEESNVDENFSVIDPTKIRHVVIKAGKIEAMSGLIDPASHLNLDYAEHRVTTCVIAEKFSINSSIKFSNERLVFAAVDRSSFRHHGRIDYTQRLSDMIEAVKKRNETSKVLRTQRLGVT